ncbi:MAG: hypothetical protein ACI9J3_004001 [Parvicellaceae bacterium]|jgi:uncharacterized protein YggE
MKKLSDKLVYIGFGVVLLMAFRPAEDPQPNKSDLESIPNSEIRVTGSADMLVPPDKISVDITYREYWHPLDRKKKSTISEIESEIVAALNEAGVKSSEIVVNSAYAWKHNWNYWHYWHDYYRHLVQKNLTVNVSSSSQLNKVIEKIKKTSIRKEGIVNIQLNGSSNENLQEYRKLVKERAMQAAQEKADYLLGAVGEKRGRLISISELADPQTATTTRQTNGYYGYPGYYGYGGWGSSTVTSSPNAGMSNSSVSMPTGGNHGGSSKGTNDLSMKPIKLRYEIEAVFKIKQ